MAKLTNEQRYTTPEERVKAFTEWCRRESSCDKCELDKFTRDCTGGGCQFYWLALEAEEKPMPCPFCRSEATVGEHSPYFDVECKCGYVSTLCETKENAISAHNRVCRAVEASKEIESEKGEAK